MKTIIDEDAAAQIPAAAWVRFWHSHGCETRAEFRDGETVLRVRVAEQPIDYEAPDDAV